MKYLVALLLFAVSPALAQQPAPQPFVPFTVTQADIAQLDTAFLNNPPRVYQQVIQQWLGGLEQKAIAAAKPKLPPAPSKKP